MGIPILHLNSINDLRLLFSVKAVDGQPIGAGLGGPDLARPPKHLADGCPWAWYEEGFERLLGGIEAQDRVGPEVADPEPVRLIHIDGISRRSGPWQLPFLPSTCGGIVLCDLTGFPFGYPEVARRV